MFCTECGTPLIDGAAFCTHCGTRVAMHNRLTKTVVVPRDPDPA